MTNLFILEKWGEILLSFLLPEKQLSGPWLGTPPGQQPGIAWYQASSIWSQKHKSPLRRWGMMGNHVGHAQHHGTWHRPWSICLGLHNRGALDVLGCSGDVGLGSCCEHLRCSFGSGLKRKDLDNSVSWHVEWFICPVHRNQGKQLGKFWTWDLTAAPRQRACGQAGCPPRLVWFLGRALQ